MPKRKKTSQHHGEPSTKSQKVSPHKAATRKKPRSDVKVTIPVPVPFAFGFNPPHERHCRRAIGDQNEPEFEPTSSFQPIPQPVSDLDWLATQREGGQSFDQFCLFSPWYNRRRKLPDDRCDYNPSGTNFRDKYYNGKICLLPLGSFQEDGNGFSVNTLAEYTTLFYGIPCEVLDTVPVKYDKDKIFASVPNSSSESTYMLELTTRYDPETSRHQVRVDTGLMDLKALMPNNCIFMVVVTLLDLYCDGPDLFVAGIGNMPSRMGIFSFFRYNPELEFSEETWHDYQTLPHKDLSHENHTQLQQQRSCKLLVHEIGHLLGINHCTYYSCVMNGSGNLAEDYRQPHHLCPVDLHKVTELFGLDVVDRYKGLAKFYKDQGMTEENKWVEKRIDDIQKKKGILSTEKE